MKDLNLHEFKRKKRLNDFVSKKKLNACARKKRQLMSWQGRLNWRKSKRKKIKKLQHWQKNSVLRPSGYHKHSKRKDLNLHEFKRKKRLNDFVSKQKVNACARKKRQLMFWQGRLNWQKSKRNKIKQPQHWQKSKNKLFWLLKWSLRDLDMKRNVSLWRIN
jgi:hypothetical protein